MLVPAALAVPATVLVVAALAVGVVGVLGAAQRLPRNRVIGVRTGWTMARVDAFRRANRVAAPAFVASGILGAAAGVAALLSPTTTAALTLLVVGGLGLLVLLAVGGTVGARYAAADRVATLEAESRPAQPCTAGAPAEADPEPCAPSGCAGSCAICPRAASGTDRAGG